MLGQEARQPGCVDAGEHAEARLCLSRQLFLVGVALQLEDLALLATESFLFGPAGPGQGSGEQVSRRPYRI